MMLAGVVAEEEAEVRKHRSHHYLNLHLIFVMDAVATAVNVERWMEGSAAAVKNLYLASD